jgi:uncharacterized protein YgiM (DUF1202 family)
MNHFLPHIAARLSAGDIITTIPEIVKFAFVTAGSLNVRVGPSVSAQKAPNRNAATYGAILRVYDESNGWLKISKSQPHWVSARYTVPVERAVVTAGSLNIRTGQGTHFPKAGNFTRGEEVFVFEKQNGWAMVGLDNLWVSDRHLDFN